MIVAIERLSVDEHDALSSDDYGLIIAGIIQELKTKGAQRRSIVGPIYAPRFHH
jgi:hypothetical protein